MITKVLSLTVFSAVALSMVVGCGGNDGDDNGDNVVFTDSATIIGFSDNVVVPTYETLASRTQLLDTAITALQAAPSEITLTAAQDAWVNMREPWEQSEAFLFGPVDAQGWDPAMDSWPLNTNDLVAVLASADALTLSYVRALPETQKGFHAVEYLLWGVDGQKTFDAVTPREYEYLVALTDELVSVTNSLATSWTDSYQGGAPFRDTFATAGQVGNTAYPSLNSAAQEILGGMSGICDEVANGKIAGPHDARNPNLVESQYNFNSLVDFSNNIRSVSNAYTGTYGNNSGASLSAYVAAKDAALDARVKAEIAASIAAINAIPTPFREAILDTANDTVIEAAQDAIRTLQATIDGDLTMAILGS